jgi:hypothetical protein
VPLNTAVEWYLKPAIEKAKGGDPTKKVNIIAHSMGGLLVRAYIQGSSYKNDIENFTMVGTPNLGASNAYYIWEGGDPKKVDDLFDSFLDSWKNFYWKTTESLFEDTYQLGSLSSSDYGKIWGFVHQYVPTVRQLLPTYRFLNHNGTVKAIASSDNVNGFLSNLNSNSNRFDRMGLPSTTDKVKTRIYYSSSEPTIGQIDITMNSDSFWTSFSTLYEDGRPYKDPTMSLIGDGTVPELSATYPCSEGWADWNSITGSHVELIRENAQEIVNDLYPESSQISKYRVATPSIPVSSLYLAFHGRIQPYLLDPLGRGLGINYTNGLIDYIIPDSTVNIGANSGSLSIDNPLDGAYTVYLKNVYSEDYSLSIGFMDTTKAIQLNYRGFNHTGTISFTFTVHSTSEERITINHTPLPPTGLQADAVSSGTLLTRLSWNASTDPEVTDYNIYSKAIDEPYLVQIGTSTVVFYDTGDPWAENSSIKTRIYAVSAVKGDGTESFLSAMVTNDDRDHDGLTDEQETSYGTNISNPDSDGDGLTDGEEYVRGTNPLLTDTDGDGYSDYTEVQAGTDPLDPNSPQTYSISGTVTGAVQLGVNMILSDTISRITTTDSAGSYSFSSLIDGAYTVTPNLSGYSFTPPSTTVTISGANVTGVDFVASVPTLIGLSSFTATATNKSILLTWTTASEIDNAGFNLYRAEPENGEYVKLNSSSIPAQGSPTSGATYQYVDSEVKNRTTYYYKLEDIDINGVSTLHGPVSATPRVIHNLR